MFEQFVMAAAAHAKNRLRSIHSPIGLGTRSAPLRPGLTRYPIQQRASVFLVPTGIARSIRPGWVSQSAVCAISGSQGALAPARRFHEHRSPNPPKNLASWLNESPTACFSPPRRDALPLGGKLVSPYSGRWSRQRATCFGNAPPNPAPTPAPTAEPRPGLPEEGSGR